MRPSDSSVDRSWAPWPRQAGKIQLIRECEGCRLRVWMEPLTAKVPEMEAHAGVRCFPVKRLAVDINASSGYITKQESQNA